MPISFAEGADYLTHGIHQATVDEVERELVHAFPASSRRPEIFGQWLELRSAVGAVVKFEKQWLNGSFVSRKIEPNDLDLVTFFRGDDVEALDQPGQEALWRLASGPNNEVYPLLDSWPVVCYSPDHGAHTISQGNRDAFENVFFSRDDRLGPTFAKGFVEVVE